MPVLLSFPDILWVVLALVADAQFQIGVTSYADRTPCKTNEYGVFLCSVYYSNCMDIHPRVKDTIVLQL